MDVIQQNGLQGPNQFEFIVRLFIVFRTCLTFWGNWSPDFFISNEECSKKITANPLVWHEYQQHHNSKLTISPIFCLGLNYITYCKTTPRLYMSQSVKLFIIQQLWVNSHFLIDKKCHDKKNLPKCFNLTTISVGDNLYINSRCLSVRLSVCPAVCLSVCLSERS